MTTGQSAQCNGGGSGTTRIKLPILALDEVLNKSHGQKRTNDYSILFLLVRFRQLIAVTKYSWPTKLFTISSIAFDCKDHRTQIDWMDSYEGDGRAYGGPDPGRHEESVLWYPVQPKTDRAADWDLVCGWNSQA